MLYVYDLLKWNLPIKTLTLQATKTTLLVIWLIILIFTLNIKKICDNFKVCIDKLNFNYKLVVLKKHEINNQAILFCGRPGISGNQQFLQSVCQVFSS